MKSFELICLSLPGLCDAAVPVAASRAGGLGILDLSIPSDPAREALAFDALRLHARRPMGLRLDPASPDAFERALGRVARPIEWILLAGGPGIRTAGIVAELRSRQLRVAVEITTLEEARAAVAAGADAVVARGHEAGGRVGEETTFVLLQRLLAALSVPVWAHGGIGEHTAAACYAAGASGIVFDLQLALARESVLPSHAREAIRRMDGSETACIGYPSAARHRIYLKPGATAAEELRDAALGVSEPGDLERMVAECAGWGPPRQSVWLIGQDACFAATLADRHRTVGGILGAIRRAISDHIRTSAPLAPLGSGAAMARSHGTTYPIVQGPMTRVSDTAEFALEVARGGGLPFLALALLRSAEVKELLRRTRELLGSRPWGVGILGFVPLELRREQLEVIREQRPDFALIAGGRPDQAMALEQDGIPTYLHVPSPGLLKLFIENGSRRFVFEGRECGGHVGPRSSFVLWNTMIDVLLEALPGPEMEKCHVLFAGGIHDARSAAMVAAMAAPLSVRGAKIGVLMGTAYLFTHEAVTAGAILEGFQEEALRCERTVLLETGPGHSTRCSETSFAGAFLEESRRLQSEGRSAEEIRAALEEMNLGRLRIASKGIRRRAAAAEGEPRYEQVALVEQHDQGMYMIGQIAAARSSLCSIQELHQEVSVRGSEMLSALPRPDWESEGRSGAAHPCDIAIIGMGCLLPRATSISAYWDNILNKVDAITEIPADRWDWRLYYDADPNARDRIYSKWGGFLGDHAFDPMRYGMPPNTLGSIEPLQLLTLEVVREALEDSGYLDQPHVRARTSVVLGAGGGVADLGSRYGIRAGLPSLVDEVPEAVLEALPEWTEDSFAGILLNVAAGRVANRFDLGGSNFTVDAACASSLAAVYLAIKELESGTSDLVIAGGADTVQNPFGYLCFSKTRALSPRGRCRTFDAGADGIVISEGLAAIVLKRLADAERDGDRIYAVIKGMASSSDGRDKGLTAPRREGQISALERAYDRAGFSPATVGLIEAHGTGTVAGDRAEVDALKSVFDAASASRQSCAIGSVKSMIGHTKCTAGVAGLIKVALALHHKVLPPTLNVTQPNPRANFPESPFYVNSETRPWIRPASAPPRRAGVSAFGFGGTNFHAVVEEYDGGLPPATRGAVMHGSRPELLVFREAGRAALAARIAGIHDSIVRGARPAAGDLSLSLWRRAAEAGPDALTLALVIEPGADLAGRLAAARALLERGEGEVRDPSGIWFSAEPLARQGRVAFLFPGQGSQYPGMLAELAVHFSEAREAFDAADEALQGRLAEPLSRCIFPPPSFTDEERAARAAALTETNVAQPALGAAGAAMMRVLESLGVKPDMAAGHSYGEYVALLAAGVFDERTLAILSEARGRSILEAAREDLGTMAAVPAGRAQVESLIEPFDDVWIANLNAPAQTVISGSRERIAEVVALMKEKGIEARPLSVACAFHSALVAPARDRLARVLDAQQFRPPRIPVYSNTTATPYPEDGRATATLLTEHLVNPVIFADEITAMHAAGARIFVEVGPRGVLTSLARQCLEGQPHLAVSTDAQGRPGLLQLLHALGQLAAHGATVNLDRLFSGRKLRELRLDALVEETAEKPLPPTTWMVNGGRARPLREALARAAAAPGDAGVPAPPRPPITARGEEKAPAAPAPPRPAAVAATAPPPVAATTGKGLTVSRGRREGIESILDAHESLMARFLEVQRTVMLAALSGAEPSPPIDVAAAEQRDKVPVQVEPVVQAVPEPTAVSGAASPARDAEPSEAAAEVAPQAPPGEDVTHQLLALVSERTGYPPEMLDLDVDMEADLGIDSIKRVEILGVMQKACLPAGSAVDPGRVEQLNASRTLRAVVKWFEEAVRTRPSPARSGEGTTPARDLSASALTAPSVAAGHRARASEAVAGGTETAVLPRFELFAAESTAQLTASRPLVLSGAHLITGEDHDLALEISRRLREAGAHPMVVCPPGRCAGGEGHVELDAATAEGAAAAVRAARDAFGSVSALVHLAAPASDPPLERMDLSAWRARLRGDVKSFFHLAKAAAADLHEAAKAGEAVVLAVSALGGRFGLCGESGASPAAGGLAGIIKTLVLEWPGIRCRLVDMDGSRPAAERAACILEELQAGDAEPEVGRAGGKRWLFRARPAPIHGSPDVPVEIGPSDVLLITGGARGITAEAALRLATIGGGPVLVLAGRSPLPDPEEGEATRGLDSAREIKAALIEEMRRAGAPISLQAVERAWERLVRDREIRANLRRLKETGARVEYHAVDVRDEAAMAALMGSIRARHGRLDGVVHGAGIIEDKLIVDKSPDSFDRVFDTKADSAFILARHLPLDSLKFLVFFASVSGPFGSRGQGDYAAANEVVNRLAARLGAASRCRIVAINWGPWGSSGMADPGVQKQFLERGVQIIAPRDGTSMLEREIRAGSGSTVVIGGGPWRIEEHGREDRPGAGGGVTELPLLAGIGLLRGLGEAVEIVREFDVTKDLYLFDHCLDGSPVVPAAMAMELMAEVAQMGWPDLHVTGLRDLRVLKGMIVDDGPREVRLTARAAAEPPHDRFGADVSVEIADARQGGQRYYRATLELADRLPGPEPYTLPFEAELEPFGVTIEEAYSRYLFHGPLFQGIAKIHGICRKGMVATLVPSSPAACLSARPAGAWLIDPVIFDSGLQMVILWARRYLDVTPLPSRYSRYARFAPLTGGPIRCDLHVSARTSESLFFIDLHFLDGRGRVLGRLEGMECPGSKAFNRLAGGHLRKA